MEVIWSRLYALRAFGATAAMIASSSTTALTSAATNRHGFQQPAAACVGRRCLDERGEGAGVRRGECGAGKAAHGLGAPSSTGGNCSGGAWAKKRAAMAGISISSSAMVRVPARRG